MENFHRKISTIIDEELRKSGSKEFAQGRNRLIGEEIVSFGVKTSEIRKIVKQHWRKNQELQKRENCFKVAKELISTKVFDNQLAGIFLLGQCQEISPKDIPRLKKLITLYLDNWATCDTFSSEVMARILRNYPKEIEILYSFAQSQNKCLRRIALVTIIKLKDKIKDWKKIAFQLLSILAEEKEPIVKKAIHWLKKRSLRRH